MKAHRVRLVLLLVLVSALLIGCVPGDGRHGPEEPAGFLWGIWHGWIAPISLVISIFNPARSIYETYNTGVWYDIGFYVAVISGFGGISLSRRRRGGGGSRE